MPDNRNSSHQNEKSLFKKRSEELFAQTPTILFDNKGNISGWDEIREYEVVVKNTRDIPARAEIMRNFTTPSWEIQNDGDFGNYEKVDLDTVKYTLQLNAHATRKFRYTHTTHHGQRAH